MATRWTRRDFEREPARLPGICFWRGARETAIGAFRRAGKRGGKGSTADFLSGIVAALPPLHEITRNAGIDLPDDLGRTGGGASRPAKEVKPAATKPGPPAEPAAE